MNHLQLAQKAREENKQLAEAMLALSEISPFTDEVRSRSARISGLLLEHMRTLNALAEELEGLEDEHKDEMRDAIRHAMGND